MEAPVALLSRILRVYLRHTVYRQRSMDFNNKGSERAAAVPSRGVTTAAL